MMISAQLLSVITVAQLLITDINFDPSQDRITWKDESIVILLTTALNRAVLVY